MSTIKTETLSTPSNATVPVDTVVNGTAKAWVNFDGTGTVAIRRAFNVSSITDNGTGNYTVNFTTAMPDESYSIVSNSGIAYGNGSNRYSVASIDTVSSAFVSSEIASTNVRVDNDLMTVVIFS